MGDSVGGGSDKARKSFSEFAEKMQADVSKQVGVLTGLVGAVVGVVGTFTVFLNIGRKVGEMLFNNGERVKTFGEEAEITAGKLGVAASSAAIFAKALEIDPDLRPVYEEYERLSAEADELSNRIAAVANGVSSAVAAAANEARIKRRNELRAEAGELAAILGAAQNEAQERTERERKQALIAGADAERDARISALQDQLRAELALVEQGEVDKTEAILLAEQERNESILSLSKDATESQVRDLQRLQELSDAYTRAKLANAEREKEAAQRARQAEEESARQAADAAEDALAESFQDRLNQIQREGLSQFDREAAAIRDEIADLREQRAELADPESVAVLEQLVSALNDKLDQLRRESKEQMAQQARDITEGYRRVTEEQFARFGLDQIFQQLAIVAQNTRPD